MSRAAVNHAESIWKRQGRSSLPTLVPVLLQSSCAQSAIDADRHLFVREDTSGYEKGAERTVVDGTFNKLRK